MKKIIIVLFVVTLIFIFSEKDELIIPKESIRFRIIANSNSLEDQALKNTIKNDLINNIITKEDYTSYKTSKEQIKSIIPNIKETLNKYDVDYDLNYGQNYFPEKEYKGITYPKGNYESLVITLGNGVGNNFWCVLYPPLCLIENQDDLDNIQYKSLIKDVLFTNNK